MLAINPPLLPSVAKQGGLIQMCSDPKISPLRGAQNRSKPSFLNVSEQIFVAKQGGGLIQRGGFNTKNSTDDQGGTKNHQMINTVRK